MKATEPPVIIEQDFQAPIERVWSALTDVALMRQWYFDNIPDFKAEVGFETQFEVESDGRDFPHRWKVTLVEPMKRIAYDWWFDNYPGLGQVEFELSAAEGKTTLKLTHLVRETFPDEIPEFRRESCVGGWEYFINDRLVSFLSQPVV